MMKILVFGASDNARHTIDVIEQCGKYEIVGIIDHFLKVGSLLSGYRILGKDEDLVNIVHEYNVRCGVITIGDNFQRYRLYNCLINKEVDFEFVNIIHPSAIIGKNVNVGRGTIIMAGVIINNDTHVGAHCYIGSNSSIDHDSTIGDFSSLSPSVTTGGRVSIGTCTAVGIGATILHKIKIGDNSLVGAGALVTEDLKNGVVAYGVPARIIRTREVGDKYL